MDLSSIRTDARYQVSPQLTSVQYPDVDLDRNANTWYKKAIGWIVGIQGDWQMGGEIIHRDFEPGVTTYALPRELIRIYKGEVMYETGSTFVPLYFRDVQANQGDVEGNDTRYGDDTTQPTADLMGANIVIRPAIEATGETVVNGIRLWAQMSLNDLDEANDIPELLEPVQRLISVGAAMEFAAAEEMWTKYRELKYQIFGDPRVKDDEGIRGELKVLYSIRSGAKRDNMNARRRSYK